MNRRKEIINEYKQRQLYGGGQSAPARLLASKTRLFFKMADEERDFTKAGGVEGTDS